MRMLCVLPVAMSIGCPTSAEKDTGYHTGVADTDTDVDTGTRTFQMTGDGVGVGVEGDCADGYCIYRITTTREAGWLELDITETGDAYLYNEAHTGFTLEAINADGSYTYMLQLAWVTDLADVVVNATTLFNPISGDGGVMSRTTWYFGAEDVSGTGFDCRVTGHDPAYYEDWCTYVVG